MFVAAMGLGLTVVMVVIAAVSLFGLWLVKTCERIAERIENGSQRAKPSIDERAMELE